MIQVKKYPKNPILVPLLNRKENSAYNPGAVVHQNKVFLFYRSEKGLPEKATSEIWLAKSNDGFNFRRIKENPVIKREKVYEKMGCEDPRVVKINNEFFLTYTAYQGRDKKGDYKIRLMGAFSKDGKNWKKFPIFFGEKSGILVPNYKWEGNFVMYFGGQKIGLAISKNLKKWKIVTKDLFLPRSGNFFDNHLVEGGPPALVRNDGLWLFYNARNKLGQFSVGLAIFDKRNPAKLLKRFPKPILKPEFYWERYGKIDDTVFATGLINFKGKWLLYYGGADKAIGVAEIFF
jgi:predicted GH43/DUF377 family glycosyl hydrolase